MMTGTNVTTTGTLATMYANNAGTSQLNLTDVIISNLDCAPKVDN